MVEKRTKARRHAEELGWEALAALQSRLRKESGGRLCSPPRKEQSGRGRSSLERTKAEHTAETLSSQGFLVSWHNVRSSHGRFVSYVKVVQAN